MHFLTPSHPLERCVYRYSQPTLFPPDTSFDSGSDFSGQFDSSWRRSNMQLSSRPQQPPKSGSRIKNLLRGISIKRTKSSTKLDKRKPPGGFMQAPHGQFYQPPPPMFMGQADPDDREPPSLKRSRSLGRVARHLHQQQPADPQNQIPSPNLPYAMPGNVSFPVMARTPSGVVPVARGRNGEIQEQQQFAGRVTSCLPFPVQERKKEEVRQTYLTPEEEAHFGGSGLRASQSHESLLTPSGAPVLLNSSGVEIRPLHPSLVQSVPNRGAAFSVVNAPDHIQRYYAACCDEDAQEWLDNLKKVNRPDLENTRHKENSLKLWIFEAKNLPSKKKSAYFCEVCLNHTLYARTTSKPKTENADPFWGEPFEFSNLSDISLVTIKLYRQSERKKKNDKHQVVGEVHIPVHEIHTLCERWYPSDLPASLSGKKGPVCQNGPALRVRARYLSVDVLPLRLYAPLKDFLLSDYLDFTRALESRLPVRAKEELTSFLVASFHRYNLSEKLIADLVMEELNRPENEAVTFRGNSIATKAMEAYLKLVGTQYLHFVLKEPISMIMHSRESCEVDPQRVINDQCLEENQNSLRVFVNVFWAKIANSVQCLPLELRQLFTIIRQRMYEAGRVELCDTVISASIFLRFICPAILGPSLFGLVHELPDAQVSRSLTLIAKTIQNLANFTPFGGKESYMTFMNRFVTEEMKNMRRFLRCISLTVDGAPPAAKSSAEVDVAFELAQIHMLMCEASVMLEQSEPGVITQDPTLAKMMTLLNNISFVLKHGEMNLPQARPSSQRYDNTPTDDWVYSNEHSDTEKPPPGKPRSHLPQSQSQMAVPRVPPHQPRMQKSLSLQRPPGPLDPNYYACVNVSENNKEVVDDEWKRMVSEATASSFPSESPNCFNGVNATPAASTTGSSGYQSFSTTSPIQFYNPTYQKSGLPPVKSHSMSSMSSEERQSPSPPHGSSPEILSSEEEEEVEVEEVAALPGHNSMSSKNSSSPEKPLRHRPDLAMFMRSTPPSSAGCSDPDSVPADDSSLEMPYPRSKGLSPSGSHQTPGSDASSWVFSDSLPSGASPHAKPGVKMGVRSVQRSRQDKSQLEYEKELQVIQMELSETRQKLEKTEERLISNESEKAGLMAEFQRKLEESQRQMKAQEAEKDQQMREIIQRLRMLETDLKKEPKNGPPLTDSI